MCDSLQAYRWAWIGIGTWALKIIVLAPFYMKGIGEPFPWEFRAASCLIETVILLQIYCHVLSGSGQNLGETWAAYFSRRAVIFAVFYMAAVIGVLWSECSGLGTITIGALSIHIPLLLLLIAAVWMMRRMALLRRRYPVIGES